MRPLSSRPWQARESEVTPQSLVLGRRRLLQGSLATAALALSDWSVAGPSTSGLAPERYPAAANPRFTVDRPLTEREWATRYNNFFEFGSHKQIWQAAQSLQLRPWRISFDGLIEQPFVIDAEDLIRRMPLEERIYRHRCVEAWSMVVPWTGFPLKALVDFARPLSSAKYLRMESFMDPGMAPGQRQFWYPWPYVEGLTMAEATHELAFIATGLYGEPLPKQNGAPLRLVVPWKYGFKSIKSIVRFTFTDQRPQTFWEQMVPEEYGFWANVNPAVPHPRWSQAQERVLGTAEVVPTLLFNGYAEWVADLYRGLEGERLFM